MADLKILDKETGMVLVIPESVREAYQRLPDEKTKEVARKLLGAKIRQLRLKAAH